VTVPSAAANGRRSIVVAPSVPNTGVSLLKVVPIWVASAVINVGLLGAFFTLFTLLGALSAAEPEEPPPPPSADVAEEPPPDKDLTNTDLGIDDTLETNYFVDRLEDVSVPGKVDPTAAVGIVGAPPDAPVTNIPPPPGSGGGTGAGVFDKNESGVGSMFGTPGGMGGPNYGISGFAGRSGATRQKMLAEGGGNERSEQAVALGLEWLALHQAADGHWGLHDFHRHARTAPLPGGKVAPDNSTPGTSRRNDTAGTAFGLLPFLAAGITHKPAAKKQLKDYSKTVGAALRWLINRQSKASSDRGYYGGDMYAHALATIAMCEAYGLTSDPLLKASAQMGLNYTVNAQDVGGGWRYAPRTAGDTSVTGWHLMALKSGQMAGLSVPRRTLDRVEKFLNQVEVRGASSIEGGGGYSYTPGSGESPSMTSVGLLCRQYLGINPRNPSLLKGVEKLKKYPPGRFDNLYYLYYATQVMHHMGGEHWKFWNLGPDGDGKGGIRDTLIAKQDQGTGGRPGNRGTWAGNEHVGGRLGGTSLTLLTLEVYYRHLPLYRRDMGVTKPENK
jgi:hypothetical protein